GPVRCHDPSSFPVPEDGDGDPVGILEVEDLSRGDIDRSRVGDASSVKVCGPLSHVLLGRHAEGEVIEPDDGRSNVVGGDPRCSTSPTDKPPSAKRYTIALRVEDSSRNSSTMP